MNRNRHACLGLVLAALLTGCSDDGPTTGLLTLAVTDAPVDDATAVVVEFTGIEVKPAGQGAVSFDYDAPRQIDLLALEGGLSAPLLDGVLVPAGEYAWIRLKVGATPGTTESFVQLDDGSVHPLRIPSGAESGLKLNGGVTVAAGGVSAFTVDFDLRKSLHRPNGQGGDYQLRPTLRLVDDLEVGTIAGTVGATLLTPGCVPAVYAYAGGLALVPDDVGGAGLDPIASARVAVDPNGAAPASYAIAFLPAGDYTVAFTCDADADQPDGDETLVFAPIAGATVTAGATTTVDFGL